MSKVTVNLLSPIQVGDQTISELTFREAEVGDLIDVAECSHEMERIAKMIALITNTDLAVIRKIKARDLKNIMKQVGDLMGNESSK